MLSLLIASLFLTMVPIQALDPSPAPERKPDPVLDLTGSCDVPIWTVGDYWNYTTQFTYKMTIIIPINIPFSGWINMTVSTMFLEATGNRDPVYILDIEGNVTGHTTVPLYGDVDIYITIKGYYWQRMQDLAVYRMVLNATVSGTEEGINGFYPFGYEFYPPMEEYDFPLINGDSWQVRTIASLPFSPGSPGPVIDSEFTCLSSIDKTVPAGKFSSYPVAIDGVPSLFFNRTVGNCVVREMAVDLSGIALDIPLELNEYWKDMPGSIMLQVKDAQPVQAGSNFTVEGSYDGMIASLSLYIPGSVRVHTSSIGFGLFTATITAPWDADDTPTSVDHASLGILAIVIGDSSGYSVCTVTTKATDLMINDTMVKATPSGNGTIDDPVILNISIMNPSNFGAGPFMVQAMIDDGIDDITVLELGTYSLEAASIMYIQSSFDPAGPGQYSVGIWVDPIDQVAEYNESNNAASTVFSVKPRYELMWDTAPIGRNITIEEGMNVTFHASAQREGSLMTGKWYLGDALVGTGGSFRFDARYIGPNSSVGSPFDVRYVLDPGQSFADEVSEVGWSLKVMNVDRAPMITEVTPAQGTVSVMEGSLKDFTATAMDPDGDPLELTWTLDGAVCGTGNDLTFVAEFIGANSSSGSPYNLSLSVSSGDFTLYRFWNIDVVNIDRGFILTTHPDDMNITLRSGENATLWANVSDPDGDEPIVRWSFLDRMVNATYALTLVADDLGLSENTTFFVTVSVGSGEFSANRTWMVRFIYIPEIPPPEKIPPRNVTIVSPLSGYMYKTGDIIVLRANHTETRKTAFTWTLAGKTYTGQTVEVTGLLPGNYNATLNASVAYPAPAWIIRTVKFNVADQEVHNPQDEEGDNTLVYILAAIAVILLMFVLISLYLMMRWRKDQAKIPDFEITERYEE
jgi:hypothetical protein